MQHSWAITLTKKLTAQSSDLKPKTLHSVLTPNINTGFWWKINATLDGKVTLYKHIKNNPMLKAKSGSTHYNLCPFLCWAVQKLKRTIMSYFWKNNTIKNVWIKNKKIMETKIHFTLFSKSLHVFIGNHVNILFSFTFGGKPSCWIPVILVSFGKP